jgi:hypothetical protein
MYSCKKCKEPVLVLPGQEPIRNCNCNTTIIADVTAIATGQGGIKI